MPNVTYDGQSFLLNGRRTWLVGASIQYSLAAPSSWPHIILAAKQAGFNLIDTSIPWSRHEPRSGRFDFAGPNDLRRFVTLCGEAGLRVLLRIGPNIGGSFDGGGMPSWLNDVPDMSFREGNDAFLERVSAFYHRALERVVDLQITTQDGPAGRDGGPLLLVQFEHAWHCSNEDQGYDYLRELARFVRESGITVPLLTANDLWQDVEGAIETWTGSEDLLVNLRQLRGLQSHAPRLVTLSDRKRIEIWGRPAAEASGPDELLRRAAEVLAAGAQFIITPFHAGQHPGFGGGRLCGPDGGFATPRTLGAAVDEACRRTPNYAAVKRLASFASTFGYLFTELDPDYHPISIDLSEINGGNGKQKGRAKSADIAVVPLHGSQGSVVFVFTSTDGPKSTTLLLENGMRMPVHLGDEPVGWYILDVDLAGKGRLDYSNLRPWALIGGSIVVLYGPEKLPAYVSIDGTPIEVTVPAGLKPIVIQQKDLVVVICSPECVDSAIAHEGQLWLNVNGFNGKGQPVPAVEGTKVSVVDKTGEIKTINGVDSGSRARAGRVTHGEWQAFPMEPHVSGESARFATLEGPASLTECGSAAGYGWYRLVFKTASARKRTIHIPDGADRLHLFHNGRPLGVFGDGPAAKALPLELTLAKDDVVTVLADHLGSFSDGADQQGRHGLFGHLLEVKALKATSKRVTKDPVDPFSVKGFLWGRAVGQGSDTAQVQWTIAISKKSPVLVTLRDCFISGTFLLNDEPLRWFSGAAGSGHDSFLLSCDEIEFAKKGSNTLRFAPDPHQDRPLERLLKSIQLYTVVDTPSEDAAWSFAKWEPPDRVAAGWSKAAPPKGRPCWWSTTFRASAGALHLDLNSMSKGQVFVNGQNLGRYFVAGGDGKAVGPLDGLVIPHSWLRTDADNDLLIFDEHGFNAAKVGLNVF